MLLPVEGGYEGGQVKVEELNNHDFTHECHRYFYCCAFFAGCKYEWEPIKRGCMVVLDFDIVWRPSPMSVTSSISLPSFLAATKEIKEILSSWNYPPLERKEDSKMLPENVEAENLSSECSIVEPSNKATCNVSPSYDSQDDSEEDSQDSEDNSEEDSQHSEEDSKENHLLVVPLEETYHQTNFQFSALRDKDRQIAQIFMSLDFIDVHLATVVVRRPVFRCPPVANQRARKSPSCFQLIRHEVPNPQIVQWIYSDHSIPQFDNDYVDFGNLPVNCDENFGNFRPTKSNWIAEYIWKEKYPDTYPVIVIQPRHESIRRCCDFNVDVALSYLESRLTSGANCETMQLHLITCLGCVLQFCQEEEVWDISKQKATERTLRLLKICHYLKAEKETRFLINILGQDFKKPSTNHLFYVGVRNELVARAMVDLFWNIKQGNYFIAEI